MTDPAGWLCAQTINRFFQMLDDREADAAAALFTEDGVWIRPTTRLEGREAVRQSVASRPQNQVNRHLVTNLTVDIDNDRAVARYYVTVFSHPDSPRLPAPLGGAQALLVCEDILCPQPDGWRFVTRSSRIIFTA